MILFALIFIKNMDLLAKVNASSQISDLILTKSRYRRYWRKSDELSNSQKKQIIYDILRDLDPVRISTDLNDIKIRGHFWCNLNFIERINSLCLAGDFFDGGCDLFEIPSISDRNIKIRICPAHYKNMLEGEFLLEFLFEGIVVHFLTFGLFRGVDFKLGHENLILIGGLQGCPTHLHDLRSQAVRAAHDIAPEDILLLTVFGLARGYGVKYILGVSAENHSARIFNARYNELREQLITSYNNFWIRHSAEIYGGYFLLRTFDDPVSNSQIRGGHKGRKLHKRNLKREIMYNAEAVILGSPCPEHTKIWNLPAPTSLTASSI